MRDVWFGAVYAMSYASRRSMNLSQTFSTHGEISWSWESFVKDWGTPFVAKSQKPLAVRSPEL